MDTLKKWWLAVLMFMTVAWNWVKFTAHMTWLDIVGWYWHVAYYVVGAAYKAFHLLTVVAVWLSKWTLKIETKFLVFLVSARAKW